eukprot:scaffold4498_cov119-Isochrysis_galbana.AAC.32
MSEASGRIKPKLMKMLAGANAVKRKAAGISCAEGAVSQHGLHVCSITSYAVASGTGTLLPSLWMNRRCTQFAGMPKLGISGARRLARSVRLEQLLLLAELLAGDYQGCDVTQCVQEMERSTSVAVQIETGG